MGPEHLRCDHGQDTGPSWYQAELNPGEGGPALSDLRYDPQTGKLW